MPKITYISVEAKHALSGERFTYRVKIKDFEPNVITLYTKANHPCKINHVVGDEAARLVNYIEASRDVEGVLLALEAAHGEGWDFTTLEHSKIKD